MKKCSLGILVALVFTISGCTVALSSEQNRVDTFNQFIENKPIVSHVTRLPLLIHSTNELRREKMAVENIVDGKEVDDPYNLKSLEYYYKPIYAEKLKEQGIIEMDCIIINKGTVTPVYYIKNSEKKGFYDFLLEMYVGIDAELMLAGITNPDRYIDGNAPELSAVDGVYYKDITDPKNKDIIVSTHFYWICNEELFYMNISKALMDRIRLIDPVALEGALFELNRISLVKKIDEVLAFERAIPKKPDGLDLASDESLTDNPVVNADGLDLIDSSELVFGYPMSSDGGVINADTAVAIPPSEISAWELSIVGVEGVDKITSTDLAQLEPIVAVSSSVCETGETIYTRWGGYRLRDIIEFMGAKDVTNMFAVAADGYFVKYDKKFIMDEDTVIAWEKDGELLEKLRLAPANSTKTNMYVKDLIRLTFIGKGMEDIENAAGK